MKKNSPLEYCFMGACAVALLALVLLTIVTPPNVQAVDARTITENGTNILAIGIDNRDFEVVRFYLRGTNGVLEFRADDILHAQRKVFGPERSPAKEAEREAVLAAVRANTNVTPGNVATVVSNMARLRLLDEEDASDRTRKQPK